MLTQKKSFIYIVMFSILAVACTKNASTSTGAPTEVPTATPAVAANCVGFEQNPGFRKAWYPTKGYDLVKRWEIGPETPTKTFTIPDTSDVLEVDAKAGTISLRRSTNTEVLLDYSKAVQELTPQTENGLTDKNVELEASTKAYNIKLYVERAALQCPQFKFEGVVLLKKR